MECKETNNRFTSKTSSCSGFIHIKCTVRVNIEPSPLRKIKDISRKRFHVVGDFLSAPKVEECVTCGSAKAKRMTGQFSTKKKWFINSKVAWIIFMPQKLVH